MKQNSRKKLLWGMGLLLWMGVIFYFSAQNGEESSEMSGGIIRMAAQLLWRDFDSLSLLEQAGRLDSLTFVVRKGAHFTEYAVLGFLASGFLSTWQFAGVHACRIRIGAAWCFSVLYAVSDELHQCFSDGRSPKAFDVLVDSCGAAVGIGMFFLGTWMLRRYVQKRGQR